ncbi:MAG: hypothetical protein ACLSHE_05230, partial [Roseburia sp.]
GFYDYICCATSILISAFLSANSARNVTLSPSISATPEILVPDTIKFFKFKLNKIAARWPAKAVAQFSTPK